jgi:hypothetical protein
MNWPQIISANCSTDNTTARCTCCGAIVPERYNSCRAVFNAVLEREYSDPAFGEVHLFTVDAYALQHSEQHGPRSNAFHLMRLCWLIEHGGNPGIRQVRLGSRALYDDRQAKLRQFPFLEPPTFRGKLTVVSIGRASTPEEHQTRIRAWGQSVWEAWNDHHAWARDQVRQWFDRK